MVEELVPSDDPEAEKLPSVRKFKVQAVPILPQRYIRTSICATVLVLLLRTASSWCRNTSARLCRCRSDFVVRFRLTPTAGHKSGHESLQGPGANRLLDAFQRRRKASIAHDHHGAPTDACCTGHSSMLDVADGTNLAILIPKD